jgi:SM-20-related protein
VSAVIFLSQESAAPAPGIYYGGSLVFSGPLVDPSYRETRLVAGETGTLVAFRSATTHEVTPVTNGERHSIVCWYRSAGGG